MSFDASICLSNRDEIKYFRRMYWLHGLIACQLANWSSEDRGTSVIANELFRQFNFNWVITRKQLKTVLSTVELWKATYHDQTMFDHDFVVDGEPCEVTPIAMFKTFDDVVGQCGINQYGVVVEELDEVIAMLTEILNSYPDIGEFIYWGSW